MIVHNNRDITYELLELIVNPLKQSEEPQQDEFNMVLRFITYSKTLQL